MHKTLVGLYEQNRNVPSKRTLYKNQLGGRACTTASRIHELENTVASAIRTISNGTDICVNKAARIENTSEFYSKFKKRQALIFPILSDTFVCKSPLLAHDTFVCKSPLLAPKRSQDLFRKYQCDRPTESSTSNLNTLEQGWGRANARNKHKARMHITTSQRRRIIRIRLVFYIH
jgi:hypothetical protein